MRGKTSFFRTFSSLSSAGATKVELGRVPFFSNMLADLASTVLPGQNSEPRPTRQAGTRAVAKPGARRRTPSHKVEREVCKGAIIVIRNNKAPKCWMDFCA